MFYYVVTEDGKLVARYSTREEARSKVRSLYAQGIRAKIIKQ